VPNSDWAGELAGQTIPPGDPENPLKARWLGFFDGQGIHGTDQISSLGKSASHGCIRMAIKDVKQLYAQVREGTPVFVQ
jgi:lipoprotein-anchoring transpeptidase ErfK/SrfK